MVQNNADNSLSLRSCSSWCVISFIVQRIARSLGAGCSLHRTDGFGQRTSCKGSDGQDTVGLSRSANIKEETA